MKLKKCLNTSNEGRNEGMTIEQMVDLGGVGGGDQNTMYEELISKICIKVPFSDK